MQVDPSSKLFEFVFTSRIIDVGALIVSVTAVIVSTRNAIASLKKELSSMHETIKELSIQGHRREIDIERIKERCNHHIKHRGECIAES